ncbi:MAG TPA: CCA tRNA nucleotidyltransferase, partial [Azospirillaceae bacterium]|nr:CCA tRNA nucleotidyltransferase [Azospirillaceae bacterium]
LGADWVRQAMADAGTTIPRLPLAGKDLLKAGAAPGPAVGEALKQVEAWWADAGFKPTRAACLQEALRRLGAPRQ